MAQQNRRKSRKGGSPPRRSQRPDAVPDGEHGHDHFSGEEEIVEAQLAFGRPPEAERPTEQELVAFEEADAGRGPVEDAPVITTRGGATRHADGVAGNGDSGNGGGRSGREMVAAGADDGGRGDTVAERQPGLAARAIGFVQGSWRELKRVQWPDRRQVFQATGVVLGFVIVAGAFLGVASFAANKIVNLILYGHG